MNEDELRAFLESATVDDSDGEGGSKDPATQRMSFEELSRRGRENEAEARNDEAGARPTSDSAQRDASRPRTPEPGSAQASSDSDDAELTPIVLPAPPRASKPTEPFWEQPRNAKSASQRKPERTPAEEPPSTAPLPVEPEANPAADVPERDSAGQLFGSDPLPTPETGEYEKISVVGSEKSKSHLVPWIIVGAGAVIAIVASIFIVLAVRGGTEEPPVAEPTSQSPDDTATEEPVEEPTTEPTEPEESEPAADEPPAVEVGNTGDFNIESWGVKGEISAKFGWPRYTISGDTLTFEGGTLLPQFPESCATMRTGFGITKQADGSFEVHRPAETCADAPDFYNEVWGLMAAIIPTLKPA